MKKVFMRGAEPKDSDAPCRVIARGLAWTLAAVAILAIIGLINNRQQAIQVAWWKVLLGPYAWYFSQFSGRELGSGPCHVIAALSIGMVSSIALTSTRSTRFLARLGIAIWFLTGLSLVLAWT